MRKSYISPRSLLKGTGTSSSASKPVTANICSCTAIGELANKRANVRLGNLAGSTLFNTSAHSSAGVLPNAVTPRWVATNDDETSSGDLVHTPHRRWIVCFVFVLCLVLRCFVSSFLFVCCIVCWFVFLFYIKIGNNENKGRTQQKEKRNGT